MPKKPQVQSCITQFFKNKKWVFFGSVFKENQCIFFRNPPVAKIVTFSLRQKRCHYFEKCHYFGCHYFEWAQYIFNRLPMNVTVPFCSLRNPSECHETQTLDFDVRFFATQVIGNSSLPSRLEATNIGSVKLIFVGSMS